VYSPLPLDDRYRVRQLRRRLGAVGGNLLPFLFYSASASVPCASFSASWPKTPLRSRRPVFRSGRSVRSAFVAKPPHFAFPTLGRCAPGERDVVLDGCARVLPSMPAFAGWHSLPPGFVHAATFIRRLLSASLQLAASGRRLRDDILSFASPPRPSHPKLRMVAFYGKRVAGILVPPTRKKGPPRRWLAKSVVSLGADSGLLVI